MACDSEAVTKSVNSNFCLFIQELTLPSFSYDTLPSSAGKPKVFLVGSFSDWSVQIIDW